MVSQGETLMQEKRDLERNTCTREIKEIAMDVLDAFSFHHHVSTYQVMATKFNIQVEETLGLVHISEALGRAQLAHAAIPKEMLNIEGDSAYDESHDDVTSNKGEETASKIPYWVYDLNYIGGDSQRS